MKSSNSKKRDIIAQLEVSHRMSRIGSAWLGSARSNTIHGDLAISDRGGKDLSFTVENLFDLFVEQLFGVLDVLVDLGREFLLDERFAEHAVVRAQRFHHFRAHLLPQLVIRH